METRLGFEWFGQYTYQEGWDGLNRALALCLWSPSNFLSSLPVVLKLWKLSRGGIPAENCPSKTQLPLPLHSSSSWIKETEGQPFGVPSVDSRSAENLEREYGVSGHPCFFPESGSLLHIL